MKVEHIYWFAYFNAAEPSVRYRAQYSLRYLKHNYSISNTFAYPGYSPVVILEFLKAYLGAMFFRRSNSVIVFQKIYTEGLYANLLKLLLWLRPQHTVYDIDDAEYVRRPDNTIHYFMQHCSICAAGSQALADYIKPVNENVFLLTSPVIEHTHLKKQRNPVFNIGWIGYYGAHRDSLHALLFPALLKVQFPLKLTLLGVANDVQCEEIKTYFALKNNIEIEIPIGINWYDEDSVYKRISAFDIGVSPLLDTEFNRAKSAFKLKQSLSCGVPVLASPVGENKHFITEGSSGYFCSNADEFFERIAQATLLTDAEYFTMVESALSSRNMFSMDSYCWVLIKELLFKAERKAKPIFAEAAKG